MKKAFYSLPVGGDGGDLHVCSISPDDGPASGLVIFSHGFGSTGAGDHGMFMEVAGRLAAERMSSVLFDYRGCGYSGGTFAELTPSREVEDILAVHAFACGSIARPDTRIGILSHSHGSYIALLAMPEMRRLHAACLWGAPVSPFERYSRYLSGLRRAEGCFILENGLMLGERFLDDMGRQDAEGAACAVACPVLVVHAEKDELVPLSEGKRLYGMLPCEKEMAVIEGANHSYRGQPDLQEQAVDATLGWFRRHLARA